MRDTLTAAVDNFTDTNTAAQITDACLSNLTSGGDFNVRAYFHDDAGETATLEDIAFDLFTTSNTINSVVEKTDGTGAVDISLELDGLNTADLLLTKLEHRAGADCSAGTLDPTIDDTVGTYTADSGTPTIDNSADYQVGNISVVDTGTNTVKVDWLSKTDVSNADSTFCLKVTSHNGINSSSSATTTFTLDNVNPANPGNLGVGTATTNSLTFSLGAASSDTNLNNYKIYYREGSSSVTESNNLLSTIDMANYVVGDEIGVAGLDPETDYTFNIWAYDSYGNKSQATEITMTTAAETTDEDEDGDEDDTAPAFSNFSPTKGAIKISPNTTISFNLTDAGSGVDIDTLEYIITGSKTGRHTDVLIAFTGDSSDYRITLIPIKDFSPNERVTLTLSVSDNDVNAAEITGHVFLIRPADEPDVEIDDDSDTKQAKKTKTEEDTKTEKEAGIIDDGANITIGDLTYDGTQEVVVAPRQGISYINIYSREGVILAPPFLAYPKEYRGGVNILVADLDGTNQEQEIITSPMNGPAHIRIFNREGRALTSFFARERSFTGSTLVKVANLEGPDVDDGSLEIIILFSDGILKVFNKRGQEIMPPARVFTPYLSTDAGGATLFDLEVMDLDDGDSRSAKEIIVTDHNSIRIYGKDSNQELKQLTPDIVPFAPGTFNYNQGIVLAVGDLDGTGGGKELVVGSKLGAGLVTIFNKDGRKIRPDFYAYRSDYSGGIDLIVSDLDGTDGVQEIITVAQKHSVHVRIFDRFGRPTTAGFMAFPEYTDVRTSIVASKLSSDQSDVRQDLIISPLSGSSQIRFFSKDSELINPGWYMIGIGEAE